MRPPRACIAFSNLIHNSYEVFKEEDGNNEGVSEHYDTQLTMDTSAYETGNTGVLPWESLEANTKVTITNTKITKKEDMCSTTR
jgi:hypothetical protein